MRLFNRTPTRDLVAATRAVQTPHLHPAGSHRVVVLGPKGGVGKTVTAALLAHHLAELRGEITAVLDANPHTGTLRHRLVPADVPVPAPVLDLAARAQAGTVVPEWPTLARWHDLVGRLRIFANQGADPALVEAMTAQQYATVVGLLSRAAQLVVADLGTSLAGPVARQALQLADTLVIVTDLTRDTLEVTMQIISTLAAASPAPVADRTTADDAVLSSRCAELLAGAVIVVNPSRDTARADVDDLLGWLRAACSVVEAVPRDPHLATGDLIDPAAIHPGTRLAHLRVAAHVAARLPHPPLSTRPAVDAARHLSPSPSINGAAPAPLVKEA